MLLKGRVNRVPVVTGRGAMYDFTTDTPRNGWLAIATAVCRHATVENRLPPLKGRHDLEGLLSPRQRADNAQFLLFIQTARHWPLRGHIIQIKTCLPHSPLLVILSVGGLVTATECHETLLLPEELHEQQISGTMSAGFTGHVRDLITMALLKT